MYGDSTCTNINASVLNYERYMFFCLCSVGFIFIYGTCVGIEGWVGGRQKIDMIVECILSTLERVNVMNHFSINKKYQKKRKETAVG